MARQDQYIHQNKPLIRMEIEGEALTITETQKTTPYRGKDWPTACIRWKGLHRIRVGDEEFLAVKSVVSDAGPKLGVALSFERPRECPPSREEIEETRTNLNRVLRSLFGCEVTDWGPEGERGYTKEKEPSMAG